MNIDGLDLHIGDCLETLRGMPDRSVNCVITSPPYFGLRDYGVDGQIGLEATPDEFVTAMVAVFREIRRVLRDDGTLWLNLGDSYNNAGSSRNGEGLGGGRRGGATGADGACGYKKRDLRHALKCVGIKHKDLIGIPWRVAFALQADGWYLRQDIVWSKPNPMPEPVKDRCTRAHEYLFLLSKRPRYYFDAKAMKERAVQAGRVRADRMGGNKYMEGVKHSDGAIFTGSDTRNRRSVWTVTTKPFKGAHFATFPPDLIEPCVLAGCPVGGTVLDPFGGSGTTAGVAIAHGRKAILCELNPNYASLVPARVQSVLDWHRRRQPANDNQQIDWVEEATA